MEDVSLVRSAAALRYLNALDEIEGWLSPDTALAMIELGWEQLRMGLPPGMAEIGVHHGKSFLALAASAQVDETLFAIDVFERQDLNVDQSGRGDRETFLATVARFFPGMAPRLIAGSSEALRGREAEHGLKDLRFLSIDGGHTASLTLNDLQVGEAALAPAGLCALDDILSPHWTGVLTGLFRYLAGGGTLVPLVLVPNKLLLCRPAFLEHYRDFMRRTFAYAIERRDMEFGPGRIDVYGAMWAPIRTAFAAMAGGGVAPAPAAGTTAGADVMLQRMLDSTSWRITAPMRRITGQLRRMRG